MDINNTCLWQEWFTVANLTLELLTGLSRSAIYKNRNALRQAGLIDFKANGSNATKYKITKIYKEESTQESTQESVKLGDTLGTNQERFGSTLININKNINNNIKSTSYSLSSPKKGDDEEEYLTLWNSLGLNTIRKITPKRKSMLNTRLKEYGDDSFDMCINNIKKSSFLKGQNKNNWTISFDWLIKPNNYIKVLENNYQDKPRDNYAKKPKIAKNHDINSIYGQEAGDKEKRVLAKNRLKEFLEKDENHEKNKRNTSANGADG